MQSVYFGDKLAGAIAVTALMKTAKFSEETHPRESATILKNSYLDDLLDSIESITAPKQLTEDIEKGSFIDKRWMISGVQVQEGQNKVQKVLGLVWNPQSDDLSIDIKPSLQRSKHLQEDHKTVRTSNKASNSLQSQQHL